MMKSLLDFSTLFLLPLIGQDAPPVKDIMQEQAVLKGNL